MNFKYKSLMAAFSLLCLSCAPLKDSGTQTDDVLPATALQPYGRYNLNNTQDLELVSSAVHFGFSFEGDEARLYASIPNAEGHNYLQYELDGAYQKRVKVSGTSTEPIVIKVPTRGRHTVWVYKATEAHTGPIAIQKVVADDIKAIQKPGAPIIEFIGNSITCGAAMDPSEVACGTGEYHDQHNAYMAYGPRVARALNVNFVLSCVSGIGAYRNWNSDGPTMPQVYEKTDFQDTNTQRWDFSTFTPAVVSIALGTNDFSHGDGKKERLPFDSARFISSYVNFVQLVKAKYPEAQIALLSSPMLNGKDRTTLQHALTAIKEQIDAKYPADKPVALHFFQPMQASGCTGHPSVEEHGILADELTPFFSKLLKDQVKS
ncbi:GDSL-like lipase/acylhydrolase family protein [Pontibacter ummariensis]|uniref:GDSL-like Lipase/Acylhydrolase family protein n=1 Tax=Pontibacter ummariensis TaxID=1610492 RepID=A0A239I161_9BACT|nr:SGNH/GDSL hydrolase family protein [Pontibacter ummariensis]PRY10171.1 GDSL-like lipase/acylhydrolase family protein [Pontibacter ummariensis]SNS87380.1 GDSL-like Lipase/Acylhydrolase family protein [Pontibacter ummariensis]